MVEWTPDQDADEPNCYGCMLRRVELSVYGLPVRYNGGEVLASLWGIDNDASNYRSVIEAELALECLLKLQELLTANEEAEVTA
jgi:hypothetical protein